MNFEIIRLKNTVSTNDYAKEKAKLGAKEGTVIISDTQTGGRGTRERSFFSYSGGLYLSLILRPKTNENITQKAATALATAIRKISSADVGIKWVNDIFLNGKKISGILCESKLMNNGKPEYTVVGVGVNVKTNDFTKFPFAASSLENEGFDVDIEELAKEFLFQFDKIYNGEEWFESYRNYSVILGKKVYIKSANEEYYAKALDISYDGSLVVELSNGEMRSLISGDVSIGGVEND